MKTLITLSLLLASALLAQASTLQDILNTLTNRGETVEIYAQALETPSNITWVVIYRTKKNWETYSLIKTIVGADGVVDDPNLINSIARYVNPPIAASLIQQMAQKMVAAKGGKDKFQDFVNAYPEQFSGYTEAAKGAFQNLGIVFQK